MPFASENRLGLPHRGSPNAANNTQSARRRTACFRFFQKSLPLL